MKWPKIHVFFPCFSFPPRNRFGVISAYLQLGTILHPGWFHRHHLDEHSIFICDDCILDTWSCPGGYPKKQPISTRRVATWCRCPCCAGASAANGCCWWGGFDFFFPSYDSEFISGWKKSVGHTPYISFIGGHHVTPLIEIGSGPTFYGVLLARETTLKA